MWLDLLFLALKNLRRRKARSALTLLGIAVGMTAVVALLTLSLGAQRALEQEFAKLGADTILVIPASPAGGPRPAKFDLALLRTLSGVKSVGALRRETLPVQSAATTGFLSVVGLSLDLQTPRLFGGLEIERGKLFQANQDEVILGERAARELKLRLNENVRIRERPFRVVGLLKSTENEQNDYAIYVDLPKLEELSDEKGLISLAYVQAAADPRRLTEEIQKTLRRALSEQEFLVQSTQQLSELVSNTMALLRWILGSIAGISLIVGGIGLANTMLMAVLERTREIGVLKAIGARNRHILGLFLIESGLLGLLGGLVGLLLGGALAQSVVVLARTFTRSSALGLALDISLALGALLFAMVLGIIAGLWPAWRAAQLDPVEALRYE